MAGSKNTSNLDAINFFQRYWAWNTHLEAFCFDVAKFFKIQPKNGHKFFQKIQETQKCNFFSKIHSFYVCT